MGETKNGWKQLVRHKVIHTYRVGWRGALDALIAAIRRRPRHTVPPFTVSVWVKPEPPDRQVGEMDDARDRT